MQLLENEKITRFFNFFSIIEKQNIGKSSEYNPNLILTTLLLHLQAKILQWDSFAQSEIRPYLHGYVQSHQNKATTRELRFQQKQRLAKLKAALIRLDDWMKSKTFLVGERLTLADTNLAIDMLPLFNVSLDGQPLIKEVRKGQRPSLYTDSKQVTLEIGRSFFKKERVQFKLKFLFFSFVRLAFFFSYFFFV